MSPEVQVGRFQARRRLLIWLLLLLTVLPAGQVLTAAPAAAHAELVSTSPANGARLARPPAVVVLRFTEGVGLVEGGFRLLTDTGDVVGTPAPVAVASSVRWRMPANLPNGRYRVSWRVVSDDGHPIAGVFTFGVGVAAPLTTEAGASGSFPWPVVLARFAGYLGFVLLLGAVTVASAVWPQARRHHRVHLVLRLGATIAVAGTLLALLLQGPYAAGEPLTRLFDRTLLADTSHTSFGAWIQLRLFLLLAVTALTWPHASLRWAFNRGFALVCLAAVAVSFSGTGHAAAGGIAERAADSVHAFAAGVWTGGLAVLTAATATRTGGPDRPTWARFSRLALATVVVLVATGVLNAVWRLSSVTDLWQTGYGRVLAVKVLLVATAMTGGALSRRTLRRGSDLSVTVRFEVVMTVAVLAVTAALGTLAPPPRSSSASTERPVSHAAEVVRMDLGGGHAGPIDRSVDPPRAITPVPLPDAAGARPQTALTDSVRP